MTAEESLNGDELPRVWPVEYLNVVRDLAVEALAAIERHNGWCQALSQTANSAIPPDDLFPTNVRAEIAIWNLANQLAPTGMIDPCNDRDFRRRRPQLPAKWQDSIELLGAAVKKLLAELDVPMIDGEPVLEEEWHASGTRKRISGPFLNISALRFAVEQLRPAECDASGAISHLIRVARRHRDLILDALDKSAEQPLEAWKIVADRTETGEAEQVRTPFEELCWQLRTRDGDKQTEFEVAEAAAVREAKAFRLLPVFDPLFDSLRAAYDDLWNAAAESNWESQRLSYAHAAVQDFDRAVGHLEKPGNTGSLLPEVQDFSLNVSDLAGSKDLALKHGVNPEALRKRLDRWRLTHGDGCIENANPKPNQPKYLYPEALVLPEILALKKPGNVRPLSDQKKIRRKQARKLD